VSEDTDTIVDLVVVHADPPERSRDTGAITDPLKALVAGVMSESTKEIYLRDVRQFILDLEDEFGLAPDEATFDDLLRWWSWLREKEDAVGRRLKPGTVNRKVSAIRRFYREGTRRGIFQTNVSEGVPTLRINKDPKGRALAAREARVLIDCCHVDGSLIDVRDRLVVSFLLMTGARASELRRAAVSDLSVDGGHRMVTLHRKGGKEDTQKVTTDLSVLVDVWLHRSKVTEGPLIRGVGRDGDGVSFIRPGPVSVRTIHRIVKKRGELAGLGTDVGPHDLRRTYVTAACEEEVPIVRIAKSAGHSDPKTTMRYAHQGDMREDHPSDHVAQWLSREV